MQMKKYVQYGSGSNAIDYWENFDASPTLFIQNIPFIGKLLRPYLNCIFEKNVMYGDIVKGLPVSENSVDGLFCSHTLEHLSYCDFSVALNNSFNYLKPNGVFRMILPDLENYIEEYQKLIKSPDPLIKSTAAIQFNKGTFMGLERSRSTMKFRLTEAFSNNRHQWMWDYPSISAALSDHGFIDIRKFELGVSTDPMFLLPEKKYQFHHAIAVECRKPSMSLVSKV
jgi:predicted SAM-dependent methyltransferase